MSNKFFSTIAGASLLLTFIGLIGRGFGFFREIIFASEYGIEKEFDIYLIGSVISVSINTAVFYLCQNYFIPAYHNYKSTSLEKANDFLNNSVTLLFVFFSFITFLLYFFSNQIITAYLGQNSSELFSLAKNIFVITLFTIPLNAAAAILISHRQAESEFKSTAIATLFPNVAIIISIIVLNTSLGVLSIAVGYLIGIILQFVYMIFVSHKEIVLSKLMKLKNIFPEKSLASGLIIIVLIEVINQSYVLVDRFFYKSVETGGIAALNYANVLFILPISIFSLALSTAIFPKFSQAFSINDFDTLKSHFTNAIRINFFFFIPLVFLIFIFGDSFISLIFERGKFTNQGTEMTFEVLQLLTFSLVFYSSYAIINKMIYSSGLINKLFFVAIILFVLKILLNYFLVENFKQNGLALSSSIIYILLSLSGYLILRNKFKFKLSLSFLKSFLLITLNCLLALLIITTIGILFLVESTFTNIFIISVFIITYFLSSYFIDSDEIKLLRQTSKNFYAIK
ncbi:MAG: hypothetical protein C0425_08950 [Chlorobiaceae bacterium]|nr:hypothetical protein [Chlorobiaceae bacterium]MBA4310450.1 hypothetical protein [Chlorobiaceae bacterium]